jgi:hypothetical protein
MSKLINSRSNTELGQSVKEIKVAMDAAFKNSAPKNMQDLLAKADSQWKAMRTLEKLVNNDPEGHVSPLKLMTKVNASPGGKLKSGELGELADIGRAFFPTPANSGTPIGEKMLGWATSLLHSPVAGASALGAIATHGAFLADAGASAAGLAANRFIRQGMNSKAVKNALSRSGTGETHGATNALIGKVLPYSAALPELTYDRYKAQK